MIHNAQDVLNEVRNQNFGQRFTITDAQSVLDGSPNRVEVSKCYFIWEDAVKKLKIHTAQKVYDSVIAQNFKGPFTMKDAQEILDIFPKRKEINRCFLWWNESKEEVEIHCPKTLDLTYEHPDSIKRASSTLKDKIKKQKDNIEKGKEKVFPSVPKRKF